MEKYKVLTEKEMKQTVGGKNSWQTNTVGAISSAVAGAGLGTAICGPTCGFIGAHYGPIFWASVTGATGGFGK